MSYTIYYRKLFVRMPDDSFILLAEAGDNNVYTVNPRTGREVRSRSWEALFLRGEHKLSYTRDEIDAWLRERLDDAVSSARDSFPRWEDPYRRATPEEDARARFGYYTSISLHGRSCSTTSWGAFRRFFETGIRDAVPAGAFLREVSPLRFAYYEKEEGKEFSDFRLSRPFLTVEALLEGAKEHRERLGGMPWTVPSDRLRTGDVADLVCTSAGKRATVSVSVTSGNGDRREAFIRSIVPFGTTEDRSQALLLSYGSARRADLLGLFPASSGISRYSILPVR